MQPFNSIRVSALQDQFQHVEVLSQAGFEAALHVLDQNGDHFIDADEIFDLFGGERPCPELMSMLGFGSYSQLRPQTLYYGECPISEGSAEPEIDFCSDSKVNQNDAQVALDSLLSLSLYLQSNQDVIQEEERTGLFVQCLPTAHGFTTPPFDHNKKQNSAGQNLDGLDLAKKAGQNLREGFVETDAIEVIRNLSDKLVKPETRSLFESSYESGYMDDVTIQEIQVLALTVEMDPRIREYFEDVCSRALAENPDHVDQATEDIMARDSLSGQNPLDDYMGEHSSNIKLRFCR